MNDEHIPDQKDQFSPQSGDFGSFSTEHVRYLFQAQPPASGVRQRLTASLRAGRDALCGARRAGLPPACWDRLGMYYLLLTIGFYSLQPVGIDLGLISDY